MSGLDQLLDWPYDKHLKKAFEYFLLAFSVWFNQGDDPELKEAIRDLFLMS